MGFPREEYWSGWPFPTPEDLPDPGMELCLLALARRFFPTELPGISLVWEPNGFMHGTQKDEHFQPIH